MVSGMKVGWAVVGAVSLLTATVMVASRPSAFTPRLRIPASLEVPGRDSGPAPARHATASNRESPTLVQLRADGAASAPAVPRPTAPNDSEASNEIYEPLPDRDELEPSQALLRFLFQSAPYSGSHENEAELSPPSLTLPTGMPMPRG